MGKANNQLVITGAKLFTAVDENAIANGAIWVDGDSIRYAGPADKIGRVPADVEQIDVGGQFVMPGMIESHAHLSFTDAGPFSLGMPSAEEAMLHAVGNARLMLGVGFTSAVSFGSAHKVDVVLRDAINDGIVPGPRLCAAGQDLGPSASNVDTGSASGLSKIVDGPWAFRKAVREMRRGGVDIVKIFVDGENINSHAPAGELSFTDEEIEAVCDEAHRHNMRVATHSRSAAAVKQAVRAGADLIGHANYLDDEAIELLHQQRDRVFVGPGIAWDITYLEKSESIGIPREVVVAQGYEREIEATAISMKKLDAAGVRILIGGDYGISIAPHGAYATDLQYFVELFDMSPGRALLCATRDGGAAADPGGSVGTLEKGKLADLVIVNGDPLADITVLQDHDKITAVMKGGKLYAGMANKDIYDMDASELDVGGGKKAGKRLKSGVLEAAE